MRSSCGRAPDPRQRYHFAEEMHRSPARFEQLSPGRHRLRVLLPGYEAHEISVEIAPGADARLPVVRLTRSHGSLTIAATPAGTAWVLRRGSEVGHGNPALVGRTCASPLLCQIIDALRASSRSRAHLLNPPAGRESPPRGALRAQRAIARRSLRASHQRLVHSRRLPYRAMHRPPRSVHCPRDRPPRRLPPPFAPGEGVPSGARTGHPPEIVTPAPGRTYSLPVGDAAASIPLEARTESDVARLYWFSGRTCLGASSPRAPLSWHASPGAFTGSLPWTTTAAPPSSRSR